MPCVSIGSAYQELRGDEAFGYFFSLRTLPDIVQTTIALQEPHPVASYYLQHGWLAWTGAQGGGQGEFALRFPGLVWYAGRGAALWAGSPAAFPAGHALGHIVPRP
ncbi:MAG: hypothetical protein R2867_33145 [Caldilineaceae bacterium]